MFKGYEWSQRDQEDEKTAPAPEIPVKQGPTVITVQILCSKRLGYVIRFIHNGVATTRYVWKKYAIFCELLIWNWWVWKLELPGDNDRWPCTRNNMQTCMQSSTFVVFTQRSMYFCRMSTRLAHWTLSTRLAHWPSKSLWRTFELIVVAIWFDFLCKIPRFAQLCVALINDFKNFGAKIMGRSILDAAVNLFQLNSLFRVCARGHCGHQIKHILRKHNVLVYPQTFCDA